jgi:hypothetical protein
MNGFLNTPENGAGSPEPKPQPDPVTLAESLAGFTLHPGQRAILDPSLTRGILNCSRQWGKSTVAALKAAIHAYSLPDQTILIGSPSGRQSEELLLKAGNYLRQLTGHLARSREKVSLANGSRILALPNSADRIRGYSADLLILDEAARIPDDYFTAILPTIIARPGAAVLLMSTPSGRKGFFHRLWNDDDAKRDLPPNQRWTRISGPASEAQHLDHKFIAHKRSLLPMDQYEQEFECGFGPGNRSLFPPESLAYMDDPTIPELLAQYVPRKHERFQLGVDFGQRRDHSAFVMVDGANRVTRFINAGTRLPIMRPIIRIRKIGRLPLGTPYSDVITQIQAMFGFNQSVWNQTLIASDATGVGQAAAEFLRQRVKAYANLPIQITANPTRADYLTRDVSKEQLVHYLRLAIDGKFLVMHPDLTLGAELRTELENFEAFRTRTGKATFRAGRGHDDLVMALALAVWKQWVWKDGYEDALIQDYVPHDECVIAPYPWKLSPWNLFY